jgi:uncharacterized membrane protein
MRKGIKRLILITLVIVCFVSFDAAMDYVARHLYPALFNFVLYPIDVAGVIEYSMGSAILYVSSRKSVEWISTGTIACFAYSFVLIGQKLIFHI